MPVKELTDYNCLMVSCLFGYNYITIEDKYYNYLPFIIRGN